MCKCGQTDRFSNVASDEYHPSHRCSRCHNDYYLDSLMFLTDEKVVRWSAFYWNIETVKTDESWIVRAYEFIPLFDYELQKIRFRKVYIGSILLSFRGEKSFHEDYPMLMKKYVYNYTDKSIQIKELVFKDLKKELYDFVLSSPISAIAWIEENPLMKLSIQKRLELISFFMKHTHLKEYDFFYWDNFAIFFERSKEYPSVQMMLDFVFNHRKEKSIRKAYFQAYANSMKIHGRYNHMADYIFARHITDRNFLIELIRMDINVKHMLFNETSMLAVENLIEFLKEHYTQRTVTNLFLKIERDTHIMRDITWMHRGAGETYVREHFRKVPLTLENLHHEFIRVHSLCNTEFSGKVKFDYHPNDLNAQSKKESFEYRLPTTTHILSQWAQYLDNCMLSYAREIHKRNRIIFGVFKEDVLSYAVEIREHKIVQSLGYDNKPINPEDSKEIDLWFKDVYLNSWITSSKSIAPQTYGMALT